MVHWLMRSYFGRSETASIHHNQGKQNGHFALEWMGSTEYPTTCICPVQEKAWIDEQTFLDWTGLGAILSRQNIIQFLMAECSVH